MSNAKHTPGPWHRNIPPASKYVTIFAGRNTHVCHLAPENEEVEANCNLIASAPELLAALRSTLSQLRTVTAWCAYDENNDAVLALGDAAIEKAEGR